MPSLFIGVYVALYPYAAQTEQEISVEQGDLLYLLEKSQEDDWWKVKKRVLGSETEEPVGLVPNNYVQPVSFGPFNGWHCFLSCALANSSRLLLLELLELSMHMIVKLKRNYPLKKRKLSTFTMQMIQIGFL